MRFQLPPVLARSIRQAMPLASLLATLGLLTDRVTAADPSAATGNPALFDRLDANRDGLIAASETAEAHRRLFERLLRRADDDDDDVLSRDEFAKSLVPSRPEKTLEVKQPVAPPEADAARWLLLTMDTNQNAWIEKDELPKEFDDVFATIAERVDANKNDVLETQELYRAGPRLAQVANRYVRQNRVDVDSELKALRQEQGAAANRFEERRGPLENLADPERARQVFGQFDANKDGQLEPNEVPEPLQQPIRRMLRRSDRDGDGRLSQREFLAGARQFAARRAAQPANSTPAPSNSPDKSPPTD